MLQLHPVGFEKGFFGIKPPAVSLPERRGALLQTNHVPPTPPKIQQSHRMHLGRSEKCSKEAQGSFKAAQKSKPLEKRQTQSNSPGNEIAGEEPGRAA